MRASCLATLGLALNEVACEQKTCEYACAPLLMQGPPGGGRRVLVELHESSQGAIYKKVPSVCRVAPQVGSHDVASQFRFSLVYIKPALQLDR